MLFSGGSCNPTTWRRDLAIPYFKSHDITFYNPQQSNWVPEMIELEHQAKQTSQLLFFVANEKTRNIVSMIEISYLAGKKRKLICCLSKYPENNHKINNELLSQVEWHDLQAGMTVVNDVVERSGIPVFENIDTALECAAKAIKQNLPLDQLTLMDGAKPVRHADLLVGERIVRLREAFDNVDTTKSGSLSVSDLRMAFQIHVHRDLSSQEIKKVSTHRSQFNFNDFCCIVTEFQHSKSGAKKRHLNEPSKSDTPSGKSSKWSKVKHFFCRVFHKSNSPTSANNVLPMGVSHDLEEEQPNIRDGAISLLRSRRGSSIRDVYLGGSANGSWRQDAAVPMLKKHGLTYFNPQAVTRRLMPMLASAVENSRVLLFVIQGNSRSVGAMNEAAFHIGQGHKVVLVVQSIHAEESVIGDAYAKDGTKGEVLSKTALKDYNRGRTYLSDIGKYLDLELPKS